MDALANFAQQYAQQSRSGQLDVLENSQTIDAEMVDRMIRAQVGDQPGESQLAQELREENEGREPDEPVEAEVREPVTSSSPEAERADVLEEVADEAVVTEPATSTGEPGDTNEATSPATLADVLEDVSDVAEPLEPVSDVGDSAELSVSDTDDSEPAGLQQAIEDIAPLAEIAGAVEDSGPDAPAVAQAREDTTADSVAMRTPEAQRTVDLIPPSFPDEARALLDRMPVGNHEIRFSEEAAPLPEVPQFGNEMSTMMETDGYLSGLPLMSLFGDRRRDQ